MNDDTNKYVISSSEAGDGQVSTAEASLHITAQLLSGEVVDADFTAAVTVAHAREAIAKHLQVSTTRLKLLLGDQELHDHCKLGSLLPDCSMLIIILPFAVRTLCRIRPMSLREHDVGEGVGVRMVDDQTVEVTHGAMIQTFQFGTVFDCGTQDEIFHCCKHAADAALAGGTSCIIAYGQTGAGKSFSMYGPDLRDEALMGVVPRVAGYVFANVELRGLQPDVKLSMLELAARDERIVDLFQASATNVKPNIRFSRSGPVTLENVVEVTLHNREELLREIENAFHRRMVRLTQMSCLSSRSCVCAVLTVTAAGGPAGRIVMVDLCGSERMPRTCNTRETIEEARGIHRSLSALSKVLRSFSKGDKFVPYRDSKLTMLLKDCLAQTVLIVACSPSAHCADEALSSCRLATMVTECTSARILPTESNGGHAGGCLPKQPAVN